jgi:hypothetical protein
VQAERGRIRGHERLERHECRVLYDVCSSGKLSGMMSRLVKSYELSYVKSSNKQDNPADHPFASVPVSARDGSLAYIEAMQNSYRKRREINFLEPREPRVVVCHPLCGLAALSGLCVEADSTLAC